MNFFDASNFDEVQKISKFGPMDMPPGSTFEIGTQIILLQIDRFLERLDFKISPLLYSPKDSKLLTTDSNRRLMALIILKDSLCAVGK